MPMPIEEHDLLHAREVAGQRSFVRAANAQAASEDVRAGRLVRIPYDTGNS
jgi:hypothetical protein